MDIHGSINLFLQKHMLQMIDTHPQSVEILVGYIFHRSHVLYQSVYPRILDLVDGNVATINCNSSIMRLSGELLAAGSIAM
jgi:hypothetical protein